MAKLDISRKTVFVGLATVTSACILLYAQDFLPIGQSYITWWEKPKDQVLQQQRPKPLPPVPACTHAHTSLAFLKVHKAGSTSVMNILQRFAWNNDLLVALPSPQFIINIRFTNLLPLPKGCHSYDMLFNHVHRYDRKKFTKLLPANARYISIVREPLSLTISAFEYYRLIWSVKKYTRVPGPNKLMQYLRHREKYDPVPGSYTNNRMAFDFGLPRHKFRNRSFISEYLEKLDSEFDLVMILEHFAESLIILKRLMCWKLKDLLHVKKNVRSQQNPKIVFSEDELAYHKNFSMADNMFYDHFLSRFKLRLQQQDREFWEEVNVFKDMLRRTESFCLRVNNGSDAPTKSFLSFQETKFNDVFQVSRDDCSLMLLSEIPFVRKSRRKQITMVSKANKTACTG